MATADERLKRASADLASGLAQVKIPDPPTRGRIGSSWVMLVVAGGVVAVGFAVLALFPRTDPLAAPVTTSEQTTSETTVPQTTPPSTSSPTTLLPPSTVTIPPSPEISLPVGGPLFGEETGVLLLFDDGLSGLIAVDPDRGLSEHSAVKGQRPGDEPYSMIRVGNKLVVGWARITAVDIATREALSLGGATIFVPAAEPDRVWMINYPGGRIGKGEAQVWQVDVVTGEALSDPISLNADGFPDIGIKGGLALQTDTGLTLWNSESGEFTALEGDGYGITFDTKDEELAWCSGDCSTLTFTNTSTLQSEEFDPPDGYDVFIPHRGAFRGPNQESPTGRYFAALVGSTGSPEGRAIWILDRQTEVTTVVTDSETSVDFLAWSPDGDQLFATSGSYRQTVTVIWRYQISDGEFNPVVLPFNGALSLVVVDNSVSSAYLGDDATAISP